MRFLRWVFAGAAVVLLTLHVVAQAFRLERWAEHRDQRLMSKAILESRHLWRDPALGRMVSPEPETLPARVLALQRLGYLRIASSAPR